MISYIQDVLSSLTYIAIPILMSYMRLTTAPHVDLGHSALYWLLAHSPSAQVSRIQLNMVACYYRVVCNIQQARRVPNLSFDHCHSVQHTIVSAQSIQI